MVLNDAARPPLYARTAPCYNLLICLVGMSLFQIIYTTGGLLKCNRKFYF